MSFLFHTYFGRLFPVSISEWMNTDIYFTSQLPLAQHIIPSPILEFLHMLYSCAQNRDSWWALVKLVMKLQVP